jgi:putative tryptophan/tyrosine transport system substrate-binding protein
MVTWHDSEPVQAGRKDLPLARCPTLAVTQGAGSSMFDRRRRDFITLLGGAVAWPLAARAQQPAMPVIGFLTSRAPADTPQLLAAFRQGLKDTGFIEGQNVAIEYRFAGNQNERLPALAADLVHRQVSLIAATTTPAALAAKAATATIPIVFELGADPVQVGLVASLNRPGGNVTGVTQLNAELAPKRLELLHELLPTASVMALLIDPTDPTNAEAQSSSVLSAAHGLGLKLRVLNASTESDFDGVFASLTQLRAGGLVIAGHAFFTARSEQLGALAVRHAAPAVYENREFVAAGGLAGYGGGISDAYRLAGVYTGRILKGEKPGELPVQQSTKVEMFLNLKTARALGITVPLPLSGRADEVIE